MNRTDRRLLLVLRDLPQGTGTGAARSMASICELLAESGWIVRGLCTTTSEARSPTDAATTLADIGISVTHQKRRGSELVYQHRNVAYRALVCGAVPARDWEKVHGRRFDLAFAEELGSFQPDVLFTYGMYPGDLRRQHAAVRAGVRVVFGLRNEAYFGFSEWRQLSGILTPSQYLSDRYLAECGIVSTPLLFPLDPLEVVAREHDPIFMTFVNPTIAKGVDFFAQLAERLSVARPDLPFLVIESRAGAGALVAAGDRAGVDLRRHENLMISPAVPLPRDIFAPTRVLLVPSLHESAGRVAAEALMNGVPPIVSNRGGLAEMCGQAGRVLPVDDASCVEQWMDALVALMDDDAVYGAARQTALDAARRFDRDTLRPQYAAFFDAVCQRNV